MPLYGKMVHVKFLTARGNMPYFPVIETPGVIYIQSNKQVDGNTGSAVLNAVLQVWPVLVLTFVMAALSGIVMWILVSD